MNEPENIILADADVSAENSSSDEDSPMEIQNLYNIFAKPDICENIYVTLNDIRVSKSNNMFVRDYTQTELNIIRAYIKMKISLPLNIDGLFWNGNMNTSSFNLCLDFINNLQSITLCSDVGIHGITHMCEALANNASVNSLTIDYPIGTDSASVLGTFLERNTTITALIIKNYKISFEAIKILLSFLKHNTTITHITLRNKTFGIKGAQILHWIVKSPLISLDINENTIGYSGNKMLMNTLRYNTSLTHLNLRQNSICDTGMADIAEMLKTNKTLISINLDNNGITNKSIKYISDILDNNKTLTHMYLNNNKLTDNDLNQLSLNNNYSILALFRYGFSHDNTFDNNYYEFKPKNMPNVFNWYRRNRRIHKYKDTCLQFRQMMNSQIPEELINIIYNYL